MSIDITEEPQTNEQELATDASKSPHKLTFRRLNRHLVITATNARHCKAFLKKFLQLWKKVKK